TDESPDRPVVHVEPVAGKLRHKPAQGEVPSRDPLPKKGGVLADQKPRPMSAHLAGGGAARRPEPLRPFHHARRADAQRPRDHPHALARLNPRQSTFAQIHRIGSCHPPNASDSIQFLNQKPGNLGIPTDSAKFHPPLGRTYLLPPLSSGGASRARPLLPFPHPAHRTGHADRPHPALGQDLTPSPTR